MAFPTDLSAVVDNVDDVLAAHVNALEVKVGVDASAVATSLDYKVRYPPISAKARVYMSAIQYDLPDGAWTKVQHDTESYDIGSDFDIGTLVSGTADGTTADHLIDSGTNFLTSGVVTGDRVKNTTDSTYAYVTAVADGDLTLSSDIFVDTEAYEIKKARFVAPVTGYYLVTNNIWWRSTNIADKLYYAGIYVNKALYSASGSHAAISALNMNSVVTDIVPVTAGQYIEGWARQLSGGDTIDIQNHAQYGFMTIHLMSI